MKYVHAVLIPKWQFLFSLQLQLINVRIWLERTDSKRFISIERHGRRECMCAKSEMKSDSHWNRVGCLTLKTAKIKEKCGCPIIQLEIDQSLSLFYLINDSHAYTITFSLANTPSHAWRQLARCFFIHKWDTQPRCLSLATNLHSLSIGNDQCATIVKIIVSCWKEVLPHEIVKRNDKTKRLTRAHNWVSWTALWIIADEI